MAKAAPLLLPIAGALPEAASVYDRWGPPKLKDVEPRALLVGQLFLKLGNGNLDRLHRNPGAVEPSLDRLQARGRHTRMRSGQAALRPLAARLNARSRLFSAAS